MSWRKISRQRGSDNTKRLISKFKLFFLPLLITSLISSAPAFALGDFGATKAWGTTGPARSTVVVKSSRGGSGHTGYLNKSTPEIAELEKYPAGTVVFNPETAMYFNKWHTFQVVISPEAISPALITKIVSTLRRQTFVQYTSVKHVTKQMVVEISPDKPDEFEIRPNGPVVLDVVQEARHEFSVRPLKMGQLNLYLKVKALITDPETKRDRSVLLPEQSKIISIQVDSIGTLKYVVDIAKEYWVLLCSLPALVVLLFKGVREGIGRTWTRIKQLKR